MLIDISPVPYRSLLRRTVNSPSPLATASATNRMSSTSPKSQSMKLRSLPVIDIAPWVHPANEHHRGHNGGRRSTSAALHAACLTYGFFYLDISSYVSQEEMDELAQQARHFFSLPQEEKDKLALANQDGARGETMSVRMYACATQCTLQVIND